MADDFDVRAAAGRLRRLREDFDTLYGRAGGFAHDVEDDRILLADAYMAEYPADDDEPVTAEWLRANGFHRPMQAADHNCWSSFATVPGEHPETVLPVMDLEFPRNHHGRVSVWKLGCYGHYRDSNSCPTRGAVRRLAACLGIELKEPT